MRHAIAQAAPGELADAHWATAAQPGVSDFRAPVPGGGRGRHHRAFYTRFCTTAAALGYDRRSTILQWSATIKVASLLGRSPEALTHADLESGREALLASLRRHRPESRGIVALTTALFGAEATLFHLGVTDVPLRKFQPNKTAQREAEWVSVPPRPAATLRAYIEQVRLSLRPATVYGIEGALREFAIFMAEHDPAVTCVADLTRRHIEAYKLHLARRPSAKGGYLSKISLADHLGSLRTCFERSPSCARLPLCNPADPTRHTQRPDRSVPNIYEACARPNSSAGAHQPYALAIVFGQIKQGHVRPAWPQ